MLVSNPGSEPGLREFDSRLPYHTYLPNVEGSSTKAVTSSFGLEVCGFDPRLPHSSSNAFGIWAKPNTSPWHRQGIQILDN